MESENINAISCVGLVSRNSDLEDKQNVNVILVSEDIIQALSSSTYDTTHLPIKVDTVNHQRNVEAEIGNSNVALSNCTLDNEGEIQFGDNKEGTALINKSLLNLEGNLNGYVLVQTPLQGPVSCALSTPQMTQVVHKEKDYNLNSNTKDFTEKQSKKFMCKYPECTLSFPTRYKLMRHEKMHDEIEKVVNCNSPLLKHQSTQRQTNLLCVRCYLGFENELQYVRHLPTCVSHEGTVLLKNGEGIRQEYGDTVNHSNNACYGRNIPHIGNNKLENGECVVEQDMNQSNSVAEVPIGEELLYYLCPHKDCGTLFTSANDAQEHIKEAHMRLHQAEIQPRNNDGRPVSTTLEIILTNSTQPDIANSEVTNKDDKNQVESFQSHQSSSSDVAKSNGVTNTESSQFSSAINASLHLPISSFCIVKTSNASIYARPNSGQNPTRDVSGTQEKTTVSLLQNIQPSPSLVNSLTNEGKIVCFVGGAPAQKQSGNSTKYKCSVFNCNKSFKSLQSFLDHGKKHTETNRYKCKHPSCPWSFSTPYKLKRHMKSHDQVKQFKCTYPGCTSTLSTKYNLQVHLDMHKEKTTQSRCDKCNLYFDYKLQLVKHRRVAHGEGPKMPCLAEGCSRMFYTKATLCAHMKIHAKPKTMYVCNFEGCGKSFDRPTNFREHFISMHSTYRPYKCDYPECTWEFSSKSKLTRHRLTHDGIRKYQCPIENCAKKFHRREHLRGHLKVHRKDDDNGEIPIESNEDNLVYYLCPYVDCGSLFTTLLGAKQHIQKVHGTTSKECTKLCSSSDSRDSQPVSITLEAMVASEPDSQVEDIDLSNHEMSGVKPSTDQSEPVVTASTGSLLGSILQSDTEIEDSVDIHEGRADKLLIPNIKSLRTSKEEEFGLTTIFTAQDVSPSTIDPSQFLLAESQDYTTNSTVNLPDSEAMKYLNLPQSIYQTNMSTDRFLNFNDCVPTVDPNVIMEVNTPQVLEHSGQSTSVTSESSDDDLQCDANNNHRFTSGSARTDCFAYGSRWRRAMKRSSRSSFGKSQLDLHEKSKRPCRSNGDVDFDAACNLMHGDISERNLPSALQQGETYKDESPRKDRDIFIKESLRDRVFAGSTINLSDLA